jgi:hypothetical protein
VCNVVKHSLPLILSVPFQPGVPGQSGGAASKVLTLKETVDFALSNYSAVRAALAVSKTPFDNPASILPNKKMTENPWREMVV